MKNLFTQSQLTILLGVCLLVPVAYADADFSNPASIEQVDVSRHNQDVERTHFSKSDEVLVTQLGDNNYASVDVNGNRNQLSLMQEGNANNYTIQLDGDRNKLSVVQNGDGLSFGLTVNSNNRAYTLTQEKL